VATLHSAVLDGIDDVQAGHDFARGKDLNLEFIVGRFGHALAIISAAPNSVSSDFGQLQVIRHLNSGIDCAIAGAAIALAATPRPAALMN
jgi:hypothetical protein